MFLQSTLAMRFRWLSSQLQESFLRSVLLFLPADVAQRTELGHLTLKHIPISSMMGLRTSLRHPEENDSFQF